MNCLKSVVGIGIELKSNFLVGTGIGIELSTATGIGIRIRIQKSEFTPARFVGSYVRMTKLYEHMGDDKVLKVLCTYISLKQWLNDKG